MGQGSGVAMSCGVGLRRGSDPALLWLWHRLVAVAPIRPLAWEPPHAMDAALKSKKKKRERERTLFMYIKSYPLEGWREKGRRRERT